jgi:PBP1b-binding outer membrane lipoprotein LpoB
MKKIKVISILGAVAMILSSCGKNTNDNVSVSKAVMAETTIATITTTETNKKTVVSDTPDKAVAIWMHAMCSDEVIRKTLWEQVGDSNSEFGIENYQIYARSLGQEDINCFFNKDMWEVLL